MSSTTRAPSPILAFAGPLGLFIALLALRSLIERIWQGHGPLWVAAPEYWIYPLQTILCAGFVWWHWPAYGLRAPRGVVFTLAIGVLTFAIWISPQWLLGFAPRTEGFNPDLFASSPALYWSTLAMRFARLVIVVPLVEEIFWRGFLLRYLIDEDFKKVPLGSFSWLSFGAVSLLFGLEHSGPDFAAGVITGALFNLVAYRTRSLSACVLVHAVVNLLLGIYIMRTGQWGFW